MKEDSTFGFTLRKSRFAYDSKLSLLLGEIQATWIISFFRLIVSNTANTHLNQRIYYGE